MSEHYIALARVRSKVTTDCHFGRWLVSRNELAQAAQAFSTSVASDARGLSRGCLPDGWLFSGAGLTGAPMAARCESVVSRYHPPGSAGLKVAAKFESRLLRRH